MLVVVKHVSSLEMHMRNTVNLDLLIGCVLHTLLLLNFYLTRAMSVGRFIILANYLSKANINRNELKAKKRFGYIIYIKVLGPKQTVPFKIIISKG